MKESFSESPENREINLSEYVLRFESTGSRSRWNSERTELAINQNLYTSPEEAEQTGIREIGLQQGIKSAFQKNPSKVVSSFQKLPDMHQILRWQGLKSLGEKNKGNLPLGDNAHSPTFQSEWRAALDHLAFYGTLPENLSPEVSDIFSQLEKKTSHKSDGREGSMDDFFLYLFSERVPLSDRQAMIDNFLAPLEESLKTKDKTTGKSGKFTYTPPLGTGEESPLEEAEIQTRITPFYGGYYRGQVANFNVHTFQIEKSRSEKTPFLEIIELEEGQKKYTYEGVFSPEKENILEVPYGFRPIITTLQSANQWKLMRDNVGVWSLESKEKYQKTEPIKFSFQFVLDTENKCQTEEPMLENRAVIGTSLDANAGKFIEDLQSQSHLSPASRARQVCQYIHKKLRYPADASEHDHMNRQYTGMGQNIIAGIMNAGIADCHWGNIAFGEICKRLEIPHRIITGHYISKDPRFDFAAVAGTGHAWSEVWDGTKWMRLDATPSKEKNDEGKEEDHDEQEAPEGDFGENTDSPEELTPEEIEKLYQDLLDQTGKEEKYPEKTPEQRAAEQFESEKGVSLHQWQQVEAFINRVNQTSIPAELSIDKKTSTLYEEWQKLFDLIYKRRELPVRVFRGPVRQSEGDFLDDVVTAYIDIKAHDDDPSGYQRPREISKERIDVFEFEDDCILDLSGSMEGVPAEEQKKMVLSSLYNMKGLNERLQHSRCRINMRTPIKIKSRIAAFGDWSAAMHETEEDITEKKLCELFQTLAKAQGGSSGLYKSLQDYRDSLDSKTLEEIHKGKKVKILSIISDGDVGQKDECVKVIKELRDLGIIVQGLGFGSDVQDIKVICHDPTDPTAAQVLDDVRGSTLARHEMLVKHLTRL